MSKYQRQDEYALRQIELERRKVVVWVPVKDVDRLKKYCARLRKQQ